MPGAFRLGGILVQRDRVFRLGECRLSATHITNPTAWGDAAEPGVSLIMLAMEVHKGSLGIIKRPLVSLSAHALARRFERSLSRDHAAVLRDIGALLDATDDGDRVPAGGGYWIGHMITATDERTRQRVKIRNVRSYFDADMLEDVAA